MNTQEKKVYCGEQEDYVTPPCVEITCTTNYERNDTFKYQISFVDGQNRTQTVEIPFQYGSVVENGINGISTQILLHVLIHRVTLFQNKYKLFSDKYEKVLEYLKGAYNELDSWQRDKQ